MTRFAIYERVQGSMVRTWEVEVDDAHAARRVASRVMTRPFLVEKSARQLMPMPEVKRKRRKNAKR